MIHATALIDPSAKIGANVSIGAYSIVGARVEVGDGTSIGSHCMIQGPTRIGRENNIYSHASIGGDPQDKKFFGEDAELIIGDRNTIREFTTFSRGTADGGGS
ncbi:MAG TPA: acyl-[acyl-carrier-protein]--UDP-N-acetylglucosamine O-acyltransferase, partial [Arenimonas sp.]|nr:acyl-[acyl-carrier-protein]--UDP-N-acetylglucosamine O-acyltransferase [Arenimonas sp.]